MADEAEVKREADNQENQLSGVAQLKIYMEDPVASPVIAETIQLLKQLDELTKDTEDELVSGSISDLLSNFRTGLGHSINLFQNQNKINEHGQGPT